MNKSDLKNGAEIREAIFLIMEWQLNCIYLNEYSKNPDEEKADALRTKINRLIDDIADRFDELLRV